MIPAREGDIVDHLTVQARLLDGEDLPGLLGMMRAGRSRFNDLDQSDPSFLEKVYDECVLGSVVFLDLVGWVCRYNAGPHEG